MRRAIFISFIVLGAAVGLFASSGGNTGLKIVMSGFGALVGTAIGGALCRIRSKGVSLSGSEDQDNVNALDAERMSNHWLDRGRPTAAPGLPHADDNDPFSREP